MSNSAKPEYILFSESQPTTPSDGSRQSPSAGSWRFHLESIDGCASFGAADNETETPSERLALLAVVRGLEALDQPSRVTLMTKSRYVSHGLRFGLPDWRESGWQWEHFGRMSLVRNADLWQRIDRAIGIHEVRCKTWSFGVETESTSVDCASRTLASDGLRLPVLPWVATYLQRALSWIAGLCGWPQRSAAQDAMLCAP